MQRLWNVAAVVFSCSLVVSWAKAAARVDETQLVTLPGNIRAEALDPAHDSGFVPDSLEWPHMLLVLKRPPARDAAFERLIGELTDRASPNYHHWLSAREI